jgi:hypothetical protein
MYRHGAAGAPYTTTGFARPGAPSETAPPPTRLAREIGATSCAIAAASEEVCTGDVMRRHLGAMCDQAMAESRARLASGRPRAAPAFCAPHVMHPHAWLPRAFWGAPSAWTPPRDGGVLGRACGYPWAWGLPPTSGATAEEFGQRASCANLYAWPRVPERRDMMAGLPEGPEQPPEAQFASELARLKTAALSSPPAQRLQRAYTLRLSLCATPGPGAPDSQLAPPTWRTLRVSGGTPMRDIAALCAAAMGWSPSYHSYYFVDRRDGALLGAPCCEALDRACLQALHARWAVVDDARVPLAAMLAAPGDALTWLYDLGECWQHTLTVERVSEVADTPPPRLLAGGGACPPEDNNGLPGGGGPLGFARVLRAAAGTEEDAAAAALSQEELHCLCAEATRSRNYKHPRTGPPRTFRPLEFNFADASADVAHAASQLAAEGTGHACAGRVASILLGESRHDETGLVACRVCGDSCGGGISTLKKCGGCKAVLYCSRACAVMDWKARHKRECQQAREVCSALRRENVATSLAARAMPPEFAHAMVVPHTGKTHVIVLRGGGLLMDGTHAPIIRPDADRQ